MPRLIACRQWRSALVSGQTCRWVRTASPPSRSFEVQFSSCPTQRSEPIPGSSSTPHAEVSSSVASPYFATTPIFYVNADPHIGHLYSAVVTDVFTRYHQLQNDGWSGAGPKGKGKARAELSTGTDEHGLKIQKAAEGLKVDPQTLCDRVSGRFKDLADAADVKYSDYIRTTEQRHYKAVHDIWRRLAINGHIYKGAHEGWYSVSDEAFYPEGQIRRVEPEGGGETYYESIETGKRVEWTKEENWKFRMSAFGPQLAQWLRSTPNAIVPETRQEQVLTEVEGGLEDLSISRPASRLTWGIPVPDDASQRIYVWVDALVNYLTVTGYPWNEAADLSVAPQWQGTSWPADAHVVGKDIVRFHAIYWPSMLLAVGLPLPRQIFVHSHWLIGGSKMSKSVGNVVDPFQILSEATSDATRMYLCHAGGKLGSDSMWDSEGVFGLYKKMLQGTMGNLASRILGAKIRNRVYRIASDGTDPNVTLIPASKIEYKGVDLEESNPSIPVIYRSILEGNEELQKHDQAEKKELSEAEARVKELTPPETVKTQRMIWLLARSLVTLPSKLEHHMENGRLHTYIEEVLEVLRTCNSLWGQCSPWKVPNNFMMVPQSDRETLQLMFLIMEGLRMTSWALQPIMPKKMQELRESLPLWKLKDEIRHVEEETGVWAREMKLSDSIIVGWRTSELVLFPTLEAMKASKAEPEVIEEPKKESKASIKRRAQRERRELRALQAQLAAEQEKKSAISGDSGAKE